MNLHDDEVFMRDFMRAARESMAPGVYLDYQNLRMSESLEGLLGETFARCEGGGGGREGERLGLYEWVKHVITIASTDGVYGRRNPFRDGDVERAFW